MAAKRKASVVRTQRWQAREALRDKGQFWTPPWVARAMVRFVLSSGDEVFDPAVGAGAFLLAAKQIGIETKRKVRLRGVERDRAALVEARAAGLSVRDLRGVTLGDFLATTPDPPVRAFVANPPYVRHHRLSAATKRALKDAAGEILGFPLDGRAGYHVHFLIRALALLPEGGKLAFLVPADTCEGAFARPLWDWIAKRFRIDAAVTFAPEATPFPGVDTNPVVLFLSRSARRNTKMMWGRCQAPGSAAFERWVESGMPPAKGPGRADADFNASERPLAEALATGLTRAPSTRPRGGPVLGDFARVMRGIATGANDFFLLTRERATALGIPDEFLLAAVGRTRDVRGATVSAQDLERLELAGRATLLFSPDERPLHAFPAPVRKYLREGAARGLPSRALISQRAPWYKMERRDVPPFLFAYLGRRNARFVRNDAGVRPLTGFLCVYPRAKPTAGWVRALWTVLSNPAVAEALPLVGKSYGGGAIKVEPRALERLPIPRRLADEAGLLPGSARA